MEHKDIRQLNKNEISVLLKDRRSKSGKSVKDILELLVQNGIEISAKTLYSYENATSSPNVKIFFKLCDIYGIEDVQKALGYPSQKEKPTNVTVDGLILTPEESGLIALFRMIPEERRSMFRGMLEAALKS